LTSVRIRRFFRELGPGLVAGAADDDPSGISTYSTAGAAHGYSILWLVPFVIPLVVAVQLLCARLGLVTGMGLASVIRRRYPPWVLWLACGLLVVANVVNIGADLAGMAAAMEMTTGVPALWWMPGFAVGLLLLLFFTSYRQIAAIFKWLTAVLLAYVVTAFLARPDLGQVLRGTLVPTLHWDRGFVATFVAVVGTTISPYLFFWQTEEEVEEERAAGRVTEVERAGATDAELATAGRDVTVGMGYAAAIMYFILLTTASTLHAHGIREIGGAQDAAAALRPLAGDFAGWLFAAGVVGTGVLGVPVLAGSAAYAVCEAQRWRGSLDDPPALAPRFYGVLAGAMLAGLGLVWLRVDPVKALFGAAVVNGLLAPPLIVLVIRLTSDREVMGDKTSPPLLRGLAWLAFAVMALAGCALLAFPAAG